MTLQTIEIRQVRNIHHAVLNTATGLNIIIGENAAGKTSILESIYILSSGRSFRTPHIREVIQKETDFLRIVGKVHSELSNMTDTLGIEKGKLQTKIKINSSAVSQTSQLATHLPVQIVNPESHRLLEQGPKQRRQFLDWVVFHVEHQFLPVWQQYNRALKQRNAAIRSGSAPSAVKLWNPGLIESGLRVTKLRQRYFDNLASMIRTNCDELMDVEPEIRFYPGWSVDLDFQEVLEKNLNSDLRRGFTQYGPHRAEIELLIAGAQAKNYFSRGQQKMLVSAMKLAQIQLLKKLTEKQTVLLVDDLAAELDEGHRQRVLDAFIETGAQLFITATERNLMESRSNLYTKMFHVEHGEVREMV